MPDIAATRTTTSVVLNEAQSATLAEYMRNHPELKHRSAAILFLMKKGLDGVQVDDDLRERLERYRSGQEFRLTLDQVVDKLLRQALDALQQEFPLTAPPPIAVPSGPARKRQ